MVKGVHIKEMFKIEYLKTEEMKSLIIYEMCQ